ncbi:MAG TPA: hypothetical protein PLF31_00450 [Candidatus Paceibacterota bacterium]|nr:hypothetical protein [Candidatus Paceibacterota bacterium]
MPCSLHAAINIKKYEHMREFIEQGQGTGEYATFEVPSSVLSSIDSLAEITVVSKSDTVPLPLSFEQGSVKKSRNQVYARDTFSTDGKIVHMVPAGSFPKGKLMELVFGDKTQVSGTVSIFYTNANAGMDFSFWQIVAKDIPVYSSANYRDIIRMQNTIDVDKLMTAARIYRGEDAFVYDPQYMIVFKTGPVSPEPTSLVLFSIPKGDNIGLLYRYAYEEERNDTEKTYIIDFNQAGVMHDGIELTVRDRTYASYVKLYTSSDKNAWTLRETDSIWGDPTAATGTSKEKNRVSYTPTPDRYIKLELDSSVQIHSLVGISHAPVHAFVKLKNDPQAFSGTSTDTSTARKIYQPSNLRMYYSVPDIYKMDETKIKVLDSGTIVRTGAIELTIGPETKNPEFNDTFSISATRGSGERVREVINVYGQLIASSIAALGVLTIVLMIIRSKS